jgi:hypothetical protein
VCVPKTPATSPSKSPSKPLNDISPVPVLTKQTRGKKKKDSFLTSLENIEAAKKRKLAVEKKTGKETQGKTEKNLKKSKYEKKKKRKFKIFQALSQTVHTLVTRRRQEMNSMKMNASNVVRIITKPKGEMTG